MAHHHWLTRRELDLLRARRLTADVAAREQSESPIVELDPQIGPNALADPSGALVIGPDLLDALNNAEVEGVVAHEFGHFADTPRINLAWRASWALPRLVDRALTRHYEYRADQHSALVLGTAQPLIDAFTEMATLDVLDDVQKPRSFLTRVRAAARDLMSDHPATWKRIERLQEFDDEHLADLPQAWGLRRDRVEAQRVAGASSAGEFSPQPAASSPARGRPQIPSGGIAL